ncbi:MAG: tRNA (adenosine(37)-N6)-dimethylallyltransferase MiaA [Candidatus Gastranaerophilales bacterium]|nr:tRNA (adenosine(37)-N6)-dimethylallyltransferase MiaA [Candidatus Gastranaerophilales bacterium]
MKQISPIIVITGATASGKTTLAIEIAKKIGAEVICADSRIVYKDLDIVSAKPDESEKQGVIHHLIDIKSPDEGLYSAGNFANDAAKIIEKSSHPILIQGGSWFYIKSLLDEKSLIEYGENKPLRDKLLKYSNKKLWDILNEKDPLRAAKIHENNRDKVIRSLELIEAINGKLSDYKRAQNKNYNAKWYMREFEREELYNRINTRVDLMLKEGLYEEWLKNKKKYGRCEVLYNTIGYREFFDLEDKIYKDFETAVEKIKQHTRNFAKRQLTWFRQNKETLDIRPAAEFK